MFAALAMPANAQLNNTVEVTNEVRPVVKDANKINILPSVVETPVKHHEVQYSTDAKPLTSFKRERLGNHDTQEVTDGNKNGFVTLGGGSHGQVDGKLDYVFDFGKNDALGIDLSLNGFNGKPLADNYYVSDKNNTRKYNSLGTLKYDHWFQNGVNLFVNGTYENQVFNYQTVNIPGLGDDPNAGTDKQHVAAADFEAGITPWTLGSFSFDLKAGIQFYSQKYKTTFDDEVGETTMSLDFNGKYAFNEEHSAGLGVEVFSSDYGMKNVEGITHAHFTPHYSYDGEAFDIKLGLIAGTDGDIAPDVCFNYHLTPHSDLYVKAVGYDVDNDLRHISTLSPYFVLPNSSETEKLTIDAEFHQIDACAGYKFSTSMGLSGDVNVGYDMAENVANADWLIKADPDILLYNYIDFVKTQRFYINADVTYAYKDIVKVDLKNQFNGWKHKSDGEWIDGSALRPTIDLRWKADVKIVKGLHLGLNWELGYYDCPEIENDGSDVEPYERPTTSNLGASLRYKLPVKMPLSVYVKGDNLLNHKHDVFYGYRSIGANVMAGVAMSF